VIVRPAVRTGMINKDTKEEAPDMIMKTSITTITLPQCPLNCCKALLLSSEVFFII
jgi:hypothetical protein